MRRFLRLGSLLVVVAALGSGSILPAQQAIAVHGRVLQAGDNSRPLRRVRIQVFEGGSPTQAVFSDDQGAFEFLVTDSSSVTLTATKSAFLKTSISISPRSVAELIEIRLVKGSVLAGRVLDPMGSAVVGTGVRTQLLRAPGSRTTSQTSSIAGFTNDLGEFRIFGLEPGRYELYTYRDFDEQQRRAGSDLSYEATRAWLTRVPRIGEPQPRSDSVTVDVRGERRSSSHSCIRS